MHGVLLDNSLFFTCLCKYCNIAIHVLPLPHVEFNIHIRQKRNTGPFSLWKDNTVKGLSGPKLKSEKHYITSYVVCCILKHFILNTTAFNSPTGRSLRTVNVFTVCVRAD